MVIYVCREKGKDAMEKIRYWQHLKKYPPKTHRNIFESLRMRNHGITHYFAVADLISIILYWNEWDTILILNPYPGCTRVCSNHKPVHFSLLVDASFLHLFCTFCANICHKLCNIRSSDLTVMETVHLRKIRVYIF